MNHTTQDMLDSFRHSQKEFFDDNGKAHGAIYLRDEMGRMLQLINALETELKLREASIEIIKRASFPKREPSEYHKCNDPDCIHECVPREAYCVNHLK